MDNLRKSLRICGNGFRKWPSNLRVWSVFVLIAVCFFYALQGVRRLAIEQNLGVTPWVFPFDMQGGSLSILIYLAFILLFCDAPFLDTQAPYAIIRTRRRNWIGGQCMYIISGSGVFVIGVYALSVLCCLPNLGFSSDWGAVLRMLTNVASGDFAQQYIPPFGPNYNMNTIRSYTPLQGVLLCLVLFWLICCFLGLLLLVLNLRFPRTIGVLVAACFVFLDFFSGQFSKIQGLLGSRIYFFSPVSWSDLANLKSNSSLPLPSASYAVVVLLVLIALLIVFAMLEIRNKDIEVLPEV